MEVHDEHIPEETFAACLERLPQTCVELVVEGTDGVLLAKRTNEPAKGEWFWPGSRLYKGERLDDAAHRVAREELGIAVDLAEQLGVHSHFWTVTSVPGLSDRHTVNVVYRATPVDDELGVALDDQHSAYRWLSEPDPELHDYVRAYVSDYGLLERD